MASVRAFMLSLLGVRRLAEGEKFSKSFAHPFLVWEPGAWQPAPSGLGGLDPSKTVVVTNRDVTSRPAAGDALCYLLSERRPLKVGRQQGCEVMLNDATVSREHVLLEPAGTSGWTVRIAPGCTNPATLNGKPLDGKATALPSKSQLRLGEATLTFCELPALLERLDDLQKKKAAKK